MGNELASCVFTEGLIDLGPRARPPPPQPELWAPGVLKACLQSEVFAVTSAGAGRQSQSLKAALSSSSCERRGGTVSVTIWSSQGWGVVCSNPKLELGLLVPSLRRRA